MTEPPIHGSNRETFDLLCGQIEEYETIPVPRWDSDDATLDTDRGADDASPADAAHSSSIDAAILAGLVSP